VDIELRKIKYAAHASEETHCFSADIYVDGLKAGTARNEGRGGPTHILPNALREALDAYGATLPRVISPIPDDKDPSGFFSYPQRGETLIDELMSEYFLEREVKRMMTRRILFTVAGDAGLFQTTPARAADVRRWLADPALATRLKADKVLNLLPLREAVALFKATQRMPGPR
jgi:hypothetical protein